MPKKDWSKIVNSAAKKTDIKFSSEISSLTRLNDDDITSLIKETGINRAAMASVLKEVTSARKSNEAKVNAIANIDNGVNFLVGLAGKLV